MSDRLISRAYTMYNVQPWCHQANFDFIAYVAIISLSDAKQRRENLKINGFPRHWVESYWPAVDMRQADQISLEGNKHYKELKYIYERNMYAGEIGCLSSHLNIYEWFVENEDHDLMIVFEDDIMPATEDSFKQLSMLLKFFNSRAKLGESFVCHLGAKESQVNNTYAFKVRNKHRLPVYKHIDKKYGLWLAHAYIISRKAAEKYVDSKNKHFFLIDDWNKIRDRLNINVYFTDPCIFFQNEDEISTIDPSNYRADQDLNKESDSMFNGNQKLHKRVINKFQFLTRKYTSSILKKL